MPLHFYAFDLINSTDWSPSSPVMVDSIAHPQGFDAGLDSCLNDLPAREDSRSTTHSAPSTSPSALHRRTTPGCVTLRSSAP